MRLASSSPKQPRAEFCSRADRRASTVTNVAAVTLIALLVALSSSPSLAEKPAASPEPPAAKPAKDKTAAGCTQVTGSTISEAYGYKHVVSLRNGCDKAVECQVWTDVDPAHNVLRANKGESVELITRIGSPASEFKVFKECRFP